MAERFVAEYGHLRPQSDNLLAEYEVLEYAERFRQVVAYAARRQFGTAERMLGEIFRAANPIANEGQAFIPDLNAETGTIAFKPATLLQRLALELLQSRKALKRCTVCKRFFFPAKGNRQGYCDNALSDCRSESRRKKSVVNTRNFRARQERKRKGNTDAKRSDRKN